MPGKLLTKDEAVHCRIGSSEMTADTRGLVVFVHCRIGSSENQAPSRIRPCAVHCRIGSSEKSKPPAERE